MRARPRLRQVALAHRFDDHPFKTAAQDQIKTSSIIAQTRLDHRDPRKCPHVPGKLWTRDAGGPERVKPMFDNLSQGSGTWRTNCRRQRTVRLLDKACEVHLVVHDNKNNV